MNLRKLRISDSVYMLEWMHDASVVRDLQGDFLSKKISDCEEFIISAQTCKENLHMAIVDDNDEYMGTVSLKNIKNNTAEFAISVRKSAMGKGYSTFGMNKMLRIGFDDMGLKVIYWCVNPKNERAIRFYNKNGYKRVDYSQLNINGGYSFKEIREYIWYKVEQ